MIYWLGIAMAYLTLAFAGSAMLVRFVPQHALSRALRRRLWLFPAAPLLFALAILFSAVGLLLAGLTRLFETLSGRKQHVRRHYPPYGYKKERRKGRGRRISDRALDNRADRTTSGASVRRAGVDRSFQHPAFRGTPQRDRPRAP